MMFNRMKRVYNQETYKKRLSVERYFCKLKKFLKITLRTDKKMQSILELFY